MRAKRGCNHLGPIYHQPNHTIPTSTQWNQQHQATWNWNQQNASTSKQFTHHQRYPLLTSKTSLMNLADHHSPSTMNLQSSILKLTMTHNIVYQNSSHPPSYKKYEKFEWTSNAKVTQALMLEQLATEEYYGTTGHSQHQSKSSLTARTQTMITCARPEAWGNAKPFPRTTQLCIGQCSTHHSPQAL